MYSFKNDYNTIAAPKVLEAIIKYNNEQNIGYGEDYHTSNVKDILRKKTGKNVDTYLLAGGTLTNVIGLCQMMKLPYEAVMSCETGHINVHETGAIEAAGHKIITMKGENGKAIPSEVLETYAKFTDHHMVLPKVLYISNSTEIGTVYTKEELKALKNVCDKLNMYLFLDGARLGIALTSEDNDLTLKDIAKYTDMFYIGGTKNGSPMGECLVIVNNDLKENFKYLIKNKLGMLAKGFFTGICFETLITDDYYLTLAMHANNCAKKLREALNDYIYYPNKTNQVFVKIKKSLSKELSKKYWFESWESLNDEEEVIRFVTSYSTNMNMVDSLISDFKNLTK